MAKLLIGVRGLIRRRKRSERYDHSRATNNCLRLQRSLDCMYWYLFPNSLTRDHDVKTGTDQTARVCE